jgi:chitodextrinase
MRLRSALRGDGQRHAEQRLARNTSGTRSSASRATMQKPLCGMGAHEPSASSWKKMTSIMVGSVCGSQTKKAERRCC